MVKNIYCTIKYTCCSLMMSMAVTVGVAQEKIADRLNTPAALENKIGRASCRERV